MIREHFLHVVARAALRALPPLDAKRVVDAAAVPLGRYPSLDRARAAAGTLDGTGTCLSRALTVAARLDGARVVIGVEPGRQISMLHAHAWVEIDGAPLRASDPRGEEIARL